MDNGVTCKRCNGSEWVCENHTTKAWPDECSCGAGDPCPDCNVLSLDHGGDVVDEAWDALFSIGSALRKLDG